MVVLLDGTAQIEYNRTLSLSEKQDAYLDRMDQEMDAGFEMGSQFVPQPDQTQRAQFVAISLIQSILSDQEQRIAATCSYLANRLPDLKQVKATTRTDGTIGLDLVFDEAFKNQVKVDFKPANLKTGKLH